MRFHSALDIGGIESALLRQLPLLQEGRFRVSLCLLRREGVLTPELRRAGVPVHLLPAGGRLRPDSIRQLAGLLRRERVTIAHAHTRAVYTPVTVAARLARTPVMVAGLHDMHTVRGWRRKLQERLLDRWRDILVSVSAEVGDDYCRSTGIARDRCRTIYNGIDLAAFTAAGQSRDEVRNALGIDAGDLVVASIGRLVRQKAQEVLLAAAREILERAPGMRVHYLVAGEGPRLEELTAAARGMGLGDRVRFLGRQRDIAGLLRAADVLCLTSRHEGFSNVILEGLAMGVPIVTTDAGGMREAVEDGVSGFVVPVGDARAIADGLLRLLTDERQRTAMGHLARDRAQRFSLASTIQATEDLYERLLARQGIVAGDAVVGN